MTHHLALARLFIASNSFAPHPDGADGFVHAPETGSEWAAGEAALAGQEGADSELGAVLDFVRDKPDWRLTVLRCAATARQAPLDDDVFADVCGEILTGLDRGRWDAVYLSLHGAAVTTRRLRPELSLISAVRAAAGEAALGATFDQRANLAPEAAQYLSYASAGRGGAPADRKAAAARVLDRLARAAEGRLRPVGSVVKAFTIVPDPGDEEGPLLDVQALARSLETGPVLDVSVLSGFPYADMPDAGAGAMAFADQDRTAARQAAASVAAAINERRAQLWAGADPALYGLPYRKVPADLRPAL